MFNINALYYVDGYKTAHKAMLAPGTTKLYGTWIPRSLKYAPEGTDKIVSFGQQMTWRWIHDQFEENFFYRVDREFANYHYDEDLIEELKTKALKFVKDMSLYLGMEYNGEHFAELWDLGYLPTKVKSLPEGIETSPNIPHMTFINTIDGFAWLPLYLETIVSSLAWKPSTSATLAKQFRKNAIEWVRKTDPDNEWLVDFMCHDFSARGLSPWDMISSGLGHATSFRGSDTLAVIPAARYFYGEPEDEVCINSVNASEHSVTCTGIFYYEKLLREGKLNNSIKEYYSFDAPCEGDVDNPDFKAIAEWLNLRDWLKKFPKGILSIVSDTFDLWKLITFILPRLKKEILAREGKLVVRPDSGNPPDIICGLYSSKEYKEHPWKVTYEPVMKGVIDLLWDIFGGDTSSTGYKRLDPHIGAIYGDSINLERQVEIYRRLAENGYAATNIVLGVGSFTYQFNTRDLFGFAAKGAWFEIGTFVGQTDHELNDSGIQKTEYNIYKEPVTDDGTKKSLKGFQAVFEDENGEPYVKSECSHEEEDSGLLQVIYLDGKFYNETTLTKVRERIRETFK